MIEFHTARQHAWQAASVLPVEEVALADGVGRMSARAVSALSDIPHYASSAMDGWAVAGDGPWRLVPACGARAPLRSGDATPIVTGGPVPHGTEAILRSEHGLAEHDVLTASTRPDPGRHARPAGEEARRGEVLVPAGIRLSPAHVAVAAGGGVDALPVVQRPRVAFVFTGSEVVTAGMPSAGSVRDSFDPMLPSALAALGAEVVRRTRIGDSRDALQEAIPATDADLLVTTGGTGDSPVDHLRAVLGELGASLVVDGLATRPGAPALLARLPDGQLLLGLPGNPLAAVVALLTLAPPALARMHGLDLPPLARVVVARDLTGIRGRTQLIPHVIGAHGAIPSDRVGSGMLRGLADAAGVLVVPEGGIAAGESAEVLSLPW